MTGYLEHSCESESFAEHHRTSYSIYDMVNSGRVAILISKKKFFIYFMNFRYSSVYWLYLKENIGMQFFHVNHGD